MTYNALYMDGMEAVIIHFVNQDFFRKWEQSMEAIKDEAARISAVAAAGDQDHISIAIVASIRNWLRAVDAMVDAGQPVLPSIVSARASFAEAIGE
jgi:hypothetical protein